jgi:hypothetical protein
MLLRAGKVLCWEPARCAAASRQDALLGACETYCYESARCADGLDLGGSSGAALLGEDLGGKKNRGR